MNTRRSALAKIVSFIAALPFIGRAFSKEAVPAEEATKLQHMNVMLDLICLIEARQDLNCSLSNISHMLNEGIAVLIEECLKDGIPIREMKIRWVNILDRELNPDGTIGHFEIYGLRGSDTRILGMDPGFSDSDSSVTSEGKLAANGGVTFERTFPLK